MDAMLGRVLGHYELVDRLGSGGMGTVYRGVHQALQQPRAIKILRPDLASEPEVVERFGREAMIAAALRHPNIVLIYDVAKQDDLHYIVMDLLEGGTLRQIIRTSAPLPLDRVVALLGQLASALDYAHGRRVIHRDVKPGNVMVGVDDHVTLVDFGIARAAEEARLTRSGTVVGTAEYMPPEAFTSTGTEINGDLYALAVIAYELLTGKAPFRGNPTAVSYAQVNTPPPPARTLNPTVPEWVEQALLRQMSKQPGDRFPSAASFVAAIAGPGQQLDRTEMPTLEARQPIVQPISTARPAGSPVTPPQPSGPAASPVSGTPSSPVGRPMPPPPPHGADEPGTIFRPAPAPDRPATGRLIAFVVVVLALVGVGSFAIWQSQSGSVTVAQATPAPAATAASNSTAKPSAPTVVAGGQTPALGAGAVATVPAAVPSTTVTPAAAPSATSTAASAPSGPAVAATPLPASPAPATVPVAAAPPTSPPAAPTSSPSPAPEPVFQVVMDERFANNQRGWPDNQQSTAWLGDGVYHLNARDPGRFVSIGAPGLRSFGDVEVTGRFRKVGGPPGGGFGLIVRDQGPDPRDGLSQGGRYYVLEVGEGTQFGIWRRETDQWVDLIVFTPSDAVKPPPETNELTVRAIGPRLIFIVNGRQIADIVDPVLANGTVGIYVAGDGNIVEAEQFTVRAPS